jgi:hypothetical protein
MNNVVQLVVWEVWAFSFALMSVLLVHALTGKLNLSALLMKKEGDRSFSPERVQLLLATVVVATQYLAQVRKDPSHLPEVSQNWLLLLGGSHALYLGRRFYLHKTDKPR